MAAILSGADVPFTDGFVRASVLNGHLFEPFQDGDQSGVRMTTVDLVVRDLLGVKDESGVSINLH